MTATFWWIRQLILTLAGCFFLLFGIHLLISAYRLKDPFSFIMTFFASNLIILISAVMVIAFVIRMMPSKMSPKEQIGDKEVQ